MNFIALDFETGNQSQDSAISIGLVKFENGVKTDTFYSLIKPRKRLRKDYILPFFTEIHGLAYEDIKNAPMFDEVWESGLKTWLDGSLPIVAHNGTRFDMKVLKALFGKYEIKHEPIKYFDSLFVAKNTWIAPDEVENHRLTTLAEKFGIEYDAHNALADAETCGKIILLASEKFGCKSVGELMTVVGLEFGWVGDMV